MLFEKLSTKTKDAVCMSKANCPLVGRALDYILEKSVCEDEFVENVRKQLSFLIDDLRDTISYICD